MTKTTSGNPGAGFSFKSLSENKRSIAGRIKMVIDKNDNMYVIPADSSITGYPGALIRIY